MDLALSIMIELAPLEPKLLPNATPLLGLPLVLPKLPLFADGSRFWKLEGPRGRELRPPVSPTRLAAEAAERRAAEWLEGGWFSPPAFTPPAL